MRKGVSRLEDPTRPLTTQVRGMRSLKEHSLNARGRLYRSGTDRSPYSNPMDLLLWNAARRLATLVDCAVAVVVALLLNDALHRRGVVVAQVFAGAAACFSIVAFYFLRRARRFFFAAPETPPARVNPYRDNASGAKEGPLDQDRDRAARSAASALVMLAMAAAYVVVAAASR
jgi:hypothetical protein